MNRCTCEISSVVLICVAWAFKFSTTAWVAMLMPRLRSMGFMPAATDLAPSAKIALVKTVAVVVPAQQQSSALSVACTTWFHARSIVTFLSRL